LVHPTPFGDSPAEGPVVFAIGLAITQAKKRLVLTAKRTQE